MVEVFRDGERVATGRLESWLIREVFQYGGRGRGWFTICGADHLALQELDVRLPVVAEDRGGRRGLARWFNGRLDHGEDGARFALYPACPDCGGAIAWAEFGNDSGTRQCEACGSRFWDTRYSGRAKWRQWLIGDMNAVSVWWTVAGTAASTLFVWAVVWLLRDAGAAVSVLWAVGGTAASVLLLFGVGWLLGDRNRFGFLGFCMFVAFCISISGVLALVGGAMRWLYRLAGL